jgi:hypothetical protein
MSFKTPFEETKLPDPPRNLMGIRYMNGVAIKVRPVSKQRRGGRSLSQMRPSLQEGLRVASSLPLLSIQRQVAKN